MSDVFFHRYGGGRITGAESSVGSDCYICPESIVEGESHISYGSSLFTSAVRNSHLSQTSLERSAVAESHVAGAYVGDSVLQNVTVRGAHKRADLQDVFLTDDVEVEACKLRGFELSGPYLIHSDWNSQPRHHLITLPGIRIGLIECGGDRFHAGCECRPWAEWDEKEGLLRRYFLRHGWDDETFDSIRTIFDSWR